ncbi:MAG: PilZ domain-containing protein [Pseudomonadota bacterium]
MDRYTPDSEVFASFDDPVAQRDGARDSLLLSAQLRLPALVDPVTVRIRNLSPGGLMAEYAGAARIGDAAQVDVRGIGWIEGRVAWVAAGRLGIAFDAPIDPLLARKPVAAPSRSLPSKRGRTVI